MTRYFSEKDVLSRIPHLSNARLVSFLAAEIIVPVQSPDGPFYREIDVCRIELACDLCEEFDLQNDAIDMVLSLVDRLHGVRAELKAVLAAIEGEAEEVRIRLAEKVYSARSSL